MKLLFILTTIILFFSCDKIKNENIYEYKIILNGNIEDFSETGEEREYSVQLISNPDISSCEAEELLKSSEIYLVAENNNFYFSDYIVKDNIIKFKIGCDENISEKIVDDNILISVFNQKFSLNETFDLSQTGSDIRYEYKIESENTESFFIPEEGGLFSIPLKCKRLKYINGNYASEEPYNLTGVRYTSSCINGAWVHSDRIYKGTSIGDYIIELNANQPFNTDGEFSWFIKMLYNDTSIYELEIIHNQTLGNEYYIGTYSLYKSEIIEQ